ncbi:hypothetical protein [Hydrocarboniclastica marina]|uniref:hypothetical protein n=1 Tax=Hydrocarboniclastica marina TaxID=2259620 RepID=UPI0010A81712|nr:hypothetical protein [Hydrocarboniclastica marina]
MDEALSSVVARAIQQQSALKYDFEFALGRDIGRTLPQYLNSFTKVQHVRSVDQGGEYDWLIVPTLSNDFFINIRQSAGPTYDLEIVLDVLILKAQRYVDRVIVKERRRIEISAFENQDDERTALMQTIYEDQIASLYESLRQELLIVFNK